MGSLSRLSEKCRKCPFKEKCSKKRLEACAYIEPNIAQNVAMNVSESMTQPILAKHEYRDVKVAENTTITIDLEDLKKQIEKEFYKAVGLGINYET